MTRKFKEFSIDNVVYKVYEPTLADQKEANKVRNEAFAEAIASKAPLRAQLSCLLEKQGAWDDARKVKFEELSKKIDDGEKRLTEGGFSLDEAKQLAIDMAKWRTERSRLRNDIANLDNNTAEGQADNASFNYLVSACLVYNKEGKEVKYFKNMDDYLEHAGDDIAYEAARNLMYLLYGVDTIDKSLPENKFLLDFNFVDEQLRFINEEGKLVDVEGRLVNSDGNYIDENGNLVDKEGNSITETGLPKVEFKGFIKDGKTIFKKEDLVVSNAVADTDM